MKRGMTKVAKPISVPSSSHQLCSGPSKTGSMARKKTPYAQDEEAADDQEETGWKYIHGDVFRFPKYKFFFSAALGSVVASCFACTTNGWIGDAFNATFLKSMFYDNLKVIMESDENSMMVDSMTKEHGSLASTLPLVISVGRPNEEENVL
ncbi:hypothetical protein JHK87_047581 [Glycine soja]|nr:hypothetical protein JHK87_047581 [Glycine soja]